MWPASITHRFLQRFRQKKTRRAASGHRPVSLRVELLESKVLPSGGPTYAVGAAPGAEPYVWVYDAQGNEITSFLAYEQTFTGGVRTALADLNSDEIPDIVTGAGPGGGPRVRAFDGATLAGIADFMAYDTSFLGGIWVATGPISATEVGIATGADAGGGPHVRAFTPDGTERLNLFAYDTSFLGGVRVALGDGNTGPTVYATPGDGLDPTARGFAVGTGSMVFEQPAGPVGAAGGTLVAAGDLDGDGADDLFTTAVAATGTELRAFDGADGMLVNQATLGGTAEGLAVLNWGGQRALGVLGGSALTAYTLDDLSGPPTELGQAAASGWSVGGDVAAAYPQVVATAENFWYPAMAEGPDQIRLRQTVSWVGEDKYRWEYEFANTSEDSGYPVSFYELGVRWMEVSVPDLDEIYDHEVPAGWTAIEDPLSPGLFGPAVRWETSGDSIMPGESRTFKFFTPVRYTSSRPGIGYSPEDEWGSISAEGLALAPGDGPVVWITDPAGDEIGELKVAKWESAFKLNASGDVEVIASEWDAESKLNKGHDFIDLDPDRFNVWVYDPHKWAKQVPTLEVTLETTNVAGYEAYNDDPTKIALVRHDFFANWYWSDSQILASNHSPDDTFATSYIQADDVPPNTHLGKYSFHNEKEGYKFPVSDRTHMVALGGTVKAEYDTGQGKVSDTAPVKVKKVLNVHVNILLDKAGGEQVIENDDVQKDITQWREIYAQVGIRVDVVDNKFFPRDPPTGVDLSNGLDEWTEMKTDGTIDLTDEEEALLKAEWRTPIDSETKNGDDIDLFYVNYFVQGGVKSGTQGETFGASVVTAEYADSVIIRTDHFRMTPPHEGGHALMDDGSHFQWDPAAKSKLDSVNLMVEGKRMVIGFDVTASVRLTEDQQTDMYTSRPNLLFNP